MIVMSFTGQAYVFKLCFCKFKIKTDITLTWCIYIYLSKLSKIKVNKISLNDLGTR